MQSNYVFSATTLAFYPVEMESDYKRAGTWPVDALPVSDEIYDKFLAVPEGKQRGEKNGLPCWVDVPGPTHEQLVATAEQQKTALLAQATAIIAPLADAQAGGYIDDVDVPRLAEWQRYRYKLTKVDTSRAPDITLPPKPEV